MTIQGHQARSVWRVVAVVAMIATLSLGTAAIAWLDIDWQAIASLGYGGVFLACFFSALTIVVPAPGVAAVFLAGKVFNPLLVGICAGIGSAIGEFSGYLLGRGARAVLGDAAADSRKPTWVERLVRRYGLLGIFVLAVVPNPFFDVAGIAAGASRMSPGAFLLATAAGKVIRMTAVALAGYHALTLFLP